MHNPTASSYSTRLVASQAIGLGIACTSALFLAYQGMMIPAPTMAHVSAANWIAVGYVAFMVAGLAMGTAPWRDDESRAKRVPAQAVAVAAAVMAAWGLASALGGASQGEWAVAPLAETLIVPRLFPVPAALSLMGLVLASRLLNARAAWLVRLGESVALAIAFGGLWAIADVASEAAYARPDMSLPPSFAILQALGSVSLLLRMPKNGSIAVLADAAVGGQVGRQLLAGVGASLVVGMCVAALARQEPPVWQSGAWAIFLLAQSLGFVFLIARVARRANAKEARLKQAVRHQAYKAKLVDLSSDAIIVRRPSGIILFWSRGAEALYGWRSEEAVGRNINDLLDCRPSVERSFVDDELRLRGKWIGEVRQRARGGRNLSVMSRLVRGKWGIEEEDIILETNADLTHKRLAQTVLRRMEDQLALALGAVEMALWEIDVATGAMTRTGAHDAMFGLRQPLPHWDVNTFLSFVHPEDRHKVTPDALLAHFGEEGGQVECRVTWPDGAVHWLSLKGRAIFRQGEAVGIAGVSIDVTARKRDEEALRRSDAFNKRIIETSGDCIVVLDAGGRLRYMSPAGLRDLGIADFAEVAGKDWGELWDSDMRALANHSLSDAGEKGHSRFRASKTAPDGQARWWDVVVSPLADDRGAIEGFVAMACDTTAHMLAETALRESEDRLRIALEATELGTFDYDIDHDHVTVSERCGAIIGRAHDHSGNFEDFARGIHPEDKERVVAQVRAALDPNGGRDYRGEFRIVTCDSGLVKWVFMSGRAFEPVAGKGRRFVGTILDITGRKTTEQELAHSQRLFRQIAETTPDLLYIYDRSGRCTSYMNRSVAKILGYAPEDVMALGDRLLEALVHPDDLGDLRRLTTVFDSLKEGEVFAHEYRLRHKDGHYRQILSQDVAFSRDEEGRATAILGLGRDVTEQRRAEDELTRAKEAADAASLAKSAFLAAMGHEIRTPLGVVLGFSDMALAPDVTPQDRQQALLAVKRNASHLAQLIDEILDLSKVEAGRARVEAVPFSLSSFLEDISASLSLKAKEKGIGFSMESKGVVPLVVATDPLRLRQCLVNIIGNAIKYTEEGGVSVSIEVLDGSMQGLACQLAFTVADTGIGMAPSQADAVFRPFRLEEGMTTRAGGGAGLGLVLSRNLARAMGGDLRLVRTAPGQGSTFVLTVGVGLPHAGAAQKLPLARSGPSPAGRRILLVEDAPDNQLLVCKMLGTAGMRVDVAEDGIEGVRKALERDYDLILMDIQMPGMDGYQATRELRAKGFAKPVIALTAHALREVRERTMAQGFSDFVTKPILRDELVRVVIRHLGLEPDARSQLGH